MSYTATVVITTKNRKQDLRQAVESALAQDVDLEVLVIDDGSTDGTSDMIRAQYPRVRLVRSEQSLGLIVQRNRAATLASAPIIFSIDDDAAFVSKATVRQTLADFDHPRVGAVAIPYVDVRYSDRVLQRAPRDTGVYACSDYRGTAHALRRDVFLHLHGYHGYLFHQVEEGEFCIRLLNAGHIVRLGRADPLHHFESPKRDLTRVFRYQARNHLLYAWYNVPMPFLPPHLLVTSFNVLRAGVRHRYFAASACGIFLGVAAMLHEFGQRAPVSRTTYRLIRRLKRHGPLLLEEIEDWLPRAVPSASTV